MSPSETRTPPKRALDLYALLPTLYRQLDTAQGYPLAALLQNIEAQVDLLKRDIDGLWDDFFVETCAPWVVPYVGDLVANKPMHEVGARRRVDVAKTIHYRRRKGTLPMLEDLARDVTGWDAHAVAFFEHLGWTQNLNHLRIEAAPNPGKRSPESVTRVGTANLRDRAALSRVDGPFDALAHTVDVRPIARASGWHNVKKVGFFLWRLQAHRVVGAPARRSKGYSNGFHFSPLAAPLNLFAYPDAEHEEGQSVPPEAEVASPISPRLFKLHLGAYYGEEKSFAIYRGDKADPLQLVPLESVACRSLADWSEDPVGWPGPPSGTVWVDVKLGRLAFPRGESLQRGVTVTYTYGFSGELGGGPYDRGEALRDPTSEEYYAIVAKDPPSETTNAPRFSTIQDAFDGWSASGKEDAIIEIADSDVYGNDLDLTLRRNASLEIRAANEKRPSIRPIVQIDVTGEAGSELTLNGLLIRRGGLRLLGNLEKLTLAHTTLVPGRDLDLAGRPRFPARASIYSAPADTAREIVIERSIVGPIRAPAELHSLTIRDSIVDAPEIPKRKNGTTPPRLAIAETDDGSRPGPSCHLEGTTLMGDVHVRALGNASHSIFHGDLRTERTGEGCVRFSWLRDGSTAPRRYRCQPDEALKAARSDEAAIARALTLMRPIFTSTRYGEPGYAQLDLRSPVEIRTGAEDGSEMGAFSFLQQPHRESNLRLRLKEYLPFGLEAGLIYMT